MFNWFRKKPRKVHEFSDNNSAFEHACSLGYVPNIGGLLPALVEEEGGLGSEGERTFLISLPLDGPRDIWTCTLKEAQSSPQAGDLVGFRIVTVASDLPEYVNLIGYIACRLKPIFVEGKGWVIDKSYTPTNIKQDIHF